MTTEENRPSRAGAVGLGKSHPRSYLTTPSACMLAISNALADEFESFLPGWQMIGLEGGWDASPTGRAWPALAASIGGGSFSYEEVVHAIRAQTPGILLDLGPDDQTPAQEMSVEDQAELALARSRVSEAEWTAFALSEGYDLPLREIGARLGVSHTEAARLIERARTRFGDCYKTD